MKTKLLGAAALLALALLLGGCASMPDNGSPAANFSNMVTDAIAPGARDAYQAAEDDKKCRSFGYSPEVSNFYGQCRMQLQQLRANSAVVVVR